MSDLPVKKPRAPRAKKKAAGRFHHGALREAVLATSTALLEREGVEALTLRRLAAMHGVSEPALYRHFASKDALLAAVGLRGLERFSEEQVRALTAAPTPAAAVLAGGRAYLRFAVANPGWFRLWFSRRWTDEIDQGSLNAQVFVIGQASRQALRGAIAALLRRPVPPADVFDDAVDDAFRACWGLCHGLAFLVLDRAFRLVNTDEQRLAYADRALVTFVNALAATSSPSSS